MQARTIRFDWIKVAGVVQPHVLEPTSDGYARIGRRLAEQVLSDVRKARQTDDRALLVEVLKIAAHIEKADLARLVVALEQNESVAIMPVAE